MSGCRWRERLHALKSYTWDPDNEHCGTCFIDLLSNYPPFGFACFHCPKKKDKKNKTILSEHY